MNTELPSVLDAINRVMADVQAVGKADRNTQQGYSFRGVDAVVNAVGPALREHRVIVVPTSVLPVVEHYETAKGTPMRNVTITVTFRFYGPAGDHIDATVCGEAADSGDKSIPKAHSVAFRTLLLQALCIPTGDPEPDASTHERATSTRNGSKATKAQHGKLHVLIKKLQDGAGDKVPGQFESWDEYVHDYATIAYAVESRADLTKVQMGALIDKVEAKAKELLGVLL